MTAGSSSSSTSQWEVAGEGVPLPDPARCCTTDTRGCPRVCHEPQWHTRHRDRCTQNMEPVHTAQPGTAGHATPVHTWHWAHRASTRNLAHNTCTQPSQVQPGTQHLYTGLASCSRGHHSCPMAREGQTAPKDAALPSMSPSMPDSASTCQHSTAVRGQWRPPHVQLLNRAMCP